MDNSLCMATMILCEDTREKAEKNNRICQGESALMSPYDLLHSYAQQNNPQLKASTLTLVFLDKYIFYSLDNYI